VTLAQLVVTAAGLAAVVWVLWYFLWTPGPPPSAGGSSARP
jgi:hypothetical protein